MKNKDGDKAEQPQYKLFEIDWAYCEQPMIDVPEYTGPPSIGVEVEIYRIFGFTNRDDWPSRNPDMSMAESRSYVTIPCDINGNRKYAIGRLDA